MRLPTAASLASRRSRYVARGCPSLWTPNADITRRGLQYNHGASTPPPAQRVWRPRPATYGILNGRYDQVRHKKTSTVVRFDDLPQGALPADPLPEVTEEEAAVRDGGKSSRPTYPTVIQQARANMDKFTNCVLVTRVGGFYELYFEHAEEYGPLLNLKVASKKTSAGSVPMAGFPFFQLDRFLKMLVQDLGRFVAVSEEFPNTAADKVKSGGLLHNRRVARIVTPGTLIDENFMDPYVNNYVMAIHVSSRGDVGSATTPEREVGLAWLDLSTGQFFTQEAPMSSMTSVLSRVSPKEVVLDQELQASGSGGIGHLLLEDRHVVTYAPTGPPQTVSDWMPMLESEIPADSAGEFTNAEVKAASFLLHYVKDRLQGLSLKLQPPIRQASAQVMNIDKSTMRSLEIRQTIRDGNYRGSLLHAIRRTVTRSGARLLNEWLGAPSTSLEVIKARQDLVACFLADEDLRDSIVLLLKRCHDSQRLVQKLAMGRGGPDEMLGLANTVKATQDIAHLLGAKQDGNCLQVMVDRINLESPLELASHIKEAIDEEGLFHQHELEDSEAEEMLALAREIASSEGSKADESALPKRSGSASSSSASAPALARRKRTTSIREHYGEDNEPWIMKPAASPALQSLHAELVSLQAQKEALAETLRERLGVASLTLRWTPGLGHICHVKGTKDMLRSSGSDSNMRTLSSSRTTRSFQLPEWTALGGQLDKARFRIRAEETRVLHALRERVVRNLVKLRRNAAVLDELDIATSFAALARDEGLTRPVLHDGDYSSDSAISTTTTGHRIIGGRHPTVEGGLRGQGRTFQRNDCFVGAAPRHGRLWLLTGTNMAGKSTFLRQNALITVLAQVGCYVPADHAELAVVDALFSRVGSADNLFADQSTFMVEMLETAHILRAATPRSFVIMDEIGRGTTPEDGAAVAFACLDHLVRVNRSRVLFATHFHVLADLVRERGLLHTGAGGDGEGAGAVEMYCTDVREDGAGGFVYDHRLRRGVNRQSHALRVARLAALPEPAIDTAREVLRRLGGHPGRDEDMGKSQVDEVAAAADSVG